METTKQVDDAIRQRLEALTKQHSQSEIARKTGVPVSNVNRYIHSARVPAEFCSALVTNFGVNPVWLLTGEGAMYLSDVRAGAAAGVGDMLEIVEAMNAVMRMKLGALAGKQPLMALRKLSDELVQHDELKTKLSDLSKPLLQRLLDDWAAAGIKNDAAAVDHCRKAANQVARFCDDRTLLYRLKGYEGVTEARRGNFERMLEIQREIFQLRISMSTTVDDAFMSIAFNYISILWKLGLRTEAHRIVQVMLALAADAPQNPAYRQLILVKALLDLEQAAHHLRPPYQQMMEAYAQLTPDRQEHWYFHRCVFQILVGDVSYGDILVIDDMHASRTMSPVSWRLHCNTMLGMAMAFEYCDHLSNACRVYTPKSGSDAADAGPAYTVAAASCLVRILNHKDRKALAAFENDESFNKDFTSSSPLRKIAATVLYSKLLRWAGHEDKALHLACDGIALMCDPERVEAPALRAQVSLYSTVLGLVPHNTRAKDLAALRVQASEFFRQGYDNGALAFGKFLAVAQPAPGRPKSA